MNDDVIALTLDELDDATRTLSDSVQSLARQLAAERQSHRAEVMRLVERAEEAELDALNQGAKLTEAIDDRNAHQARAKSYRDQLAEVKAELERATDAAVNASQLAGERLALLTEAQHQADGVGRLVALLEARERAAGAAYRESHDRIQRQAWLTEAGREADFQVARQRASARWTEAQEAVSYARQLVG